MARVIFLCILFHFSTATKEAENLKGNLISTALDVSTSKTLAEGFIVGAVGELATISLTSLQQTNISFGYASSVAFNWNSRKVYWAELDPSERVGVKRANLDGTEVEHLLEVHSVLLGVDSTTGNIYYQNFSSFDMRVCSGNGEKCSILATNQFALSDIALHPSKSLMFWTNHTAVVRANMDGTNPTVILREKALDITLDEEEDRLYWIDYSRKFITSCDLNGGDHRVLLNSTKKLGGLAVHGESVYFNNVAGYSIHAVNKHGGSPIFVVNMTGFINRIALYGSRSYSREDPCAGSPCSHLCVLKYESFACLCPDGQQIDQDGTTCV